MNIWKRIYNALWMFIGITRVLQKNLLKKGNKSLDYLKSRVCYLDVFDSVNFIFFFNVSTS